MISLIAAMTPSRVIGKAGVMPWHLPTDLAWFKRHTLGKPVIMGRKTWQSIGRPLPNRTNIVISRSQPEHEAGAIWVTDPEAAIRQAASASEVMIIGGGQLYEYFLPQSQRLYITLVQAELAGDTWFPEYQAEQWQLVERHGHPKDANHLYDCEFMILERI
ncbi:type 3 dihydrofolate reductase [Thiolinea disciformis]|uniref:type 3 dihydrofolate reductase n=1 Tax=Thiolinea disciformis TaxID=125614 RepID=UPI000370A763|nr:type 3 dihydrofolate reductase [Thiolinea disciformis]